MFNEQFPFLLYSFILIFIIFFIGNIIVRWDAKSSHEFVDNYKLIQKVFEKKGVDKYIGKYSKFN